MERGRPTKYTPEVAEEICDALGTHTLGLNALCDKYPHFPCPDTVRSWRHRHEDFSVKYLQAMQSRAMLYEEETFEIAAEKITYCDDNIQMVKTSPKLLNVIYKSPLRFFEKF